MRKNSVFPRFPWSARALARRVRRLAEHRFPLILNFDLTIAIKTAQPGRSGNASMAQPLLLTPRMIRKIAIIMICGGLLIVVAAFTSERTKKQAQHQQQQAITEVLDQAKQVESNAEHVTVPRHGRSITNFVWKTYVAGIETISTAQCPERFRLAWLNYVQAVERQTQPLRGVGSDVEFVVSTAKVSAAGEKDALDRLDKQDRTGARENVQKVALEYGVENFSAK